MPFHFIFMPFSPCMYRNLVARPVASHSLFLDIQVVTLVLKKIHLICMCKFLPPHYQAISCFSIIFTAQLHVYTCPIGCKRGFMNTNARDYSDPVYKTGLKGVTM